MATMQSFHAAHVDSFQTFYIILHDDMFQPMQFTMYSNILLHRRKMYAIVEFSKTTTIQVMSISLTL